MKTRTAPATCRAVSRRLFAWLLLLVAAAPAAFAQDAAPVHVSLSLSGEKKVFRAGEPVRLLMSFTSERDGYQLNTTTTQPPSAVDAVSLSPDAGAYAWAEAYTGGSMNHPDYASIQNLSAKPTTIGLTLNDWYRFDRPGKYSVKVSTSRVNGAGKWQPDARGALLGYLARYNPEQALPLVEQALAQVGQGQDSTLLLEVTRRSYPAEVRELLRRRLESDDPSAVGSAAYVMSQHGAEGDEPLLESRLERWRKEWAGRGAELDAPEGVMQRMAEVNLVSSLLQSKAWKLPQEKAVTITRACVTQECRRYEPK